MATQNDLKSLHVDSNTIYNRQHALQDALISEHKFITEITSNISLWSQKLSETYESDLRSVQGSLLAYEKSAYDGEISLARVAALILQNQHVIRITDKMNSVADMCR